jgi:hypothetical protein
MAAAPNENKIGPKLYWLTCILTAAAILVPMVLIFRPGDNGSDAPSAPPPIRADLPALIKAVKEAQVAYPLADNELKKSEVRKERDEAIAMAVPNGDFVNWQGTLTSMATDHDGDASIGIQFDNCKCGLVTADGAEIKIGTSLFEIIKLMKVGDRVLISGHMGNESSLTEWGSVDDPEWNASFDEVSEAGRQP